MKHLFYPTDENPTHTRTSDGMAGVLQSYPDTIQIISPLEVLTSDDGFEALPQPPAPEPPAPTPPTQAECITLGKQHVAAAGYGADEKVICLNKLLKVKDACASAIPPVDINTAYPKLVAIYAWLETVQAMAVAGQTSFPPAPHTFEEGVSE